MTDAFIRPAEASAADAISEIADERSVLEDQDDWMRHVVELGTRMKRAHPFPDAWKTTEFFVEGCASNLWLVALEENGRLFFAAAADAFITAGNAAILLRVYSGRTPAEILATPPRWMVETGVVTSMTVNRVNGAAAMAQRIQSLAAAAGQTARNVSTSTSL